MNLLEIWYSGKSNTLNILKCGIVIAQTFRVNSGIGLNANITVTSAESINYQFMKIWGVKDDL
jgi:hypothetical protein